MKTKFEIKMITNRNLKNGLFYVEFIPTHDDVDDFVKKCDQIEQSKIDDPIYLENARIDLLDEMLGVEFTNKFEK
jgi:hypothetical protein